MNSLEGNSRDDLSQGWYLDEVCCRFEALWKDVLKQGGTPPQISDFFPLAYDRGAGGSISVEPPPKGSALLVNLVMTDLEYRWRYAALQNSPASVKAARSNARVSTEDCMIAQDETLPFRPLLDDYQAYYPIFSCPQEPPLDLIEDEFRIRHLYGDRPQPEEYTARFGIQYPQLSDRLARIRDDLKEIPDRILPDLNESFTHKKTLMSTFPSGTPLRCLGDYELLEEIGRGGMGMVYKARHIRLSRLVAVKMLPEDRLLQSEAIIRFQREMQAAGILDHLNIARVQDAREVDGVHLLVMEYIEGLDLDKLLSRNGPLSIADACEIIRQAALGLEHIYENKLVHRDVKPSNLMLNTQGQVKILDLGLTRLCEGPIGANELTSHSQVMGTADYMAPEQASDAHSADIRADIYSLGCTLYKLLTGLPPFPAPQYDTTAKKIIGHSRDPVMPVRERRPEVPAELAAFLGRMLSKDPDDRTATPAEVAKTLQTFVRQADLRGLIRRVGGREEPQQSLIKANVATGEHLSSYMTETQRRKTAVQPAWHSIFRRPKTLLALAAGAAAILGAIIAITTDRGTLEIKTFSDDVKVLVAQNGREVTIIDTKTDKTVMLHSGQYEVKLIDDNKGLSLDTDKFTLRRGETIIVEVRRLANLLSMSKDSASCDRGASDTQDLLCLRVFEGHTGRVIGVAFSPDGHQALSASDDRSIRLWDVDKGTEIRRFLGHTKGVVSVAFSPDGKHALSGSRDHTIRLWDVSTGKEIKCCLGHSDEVWRVVFLPDGVHALSGSYDKTIRLWDLESGTEMRCFRGHTDRIRAVDLSAENNLVVSGSDDQTVRLWNLQSGEEIRTFEKSMAWVWCTAFLPDGLHCISDRGYCVSLWDVTRGREIRQFIGHTQLIHSVAVSRDGKRALSSGNDQSIRLWNLSTGREIAKGLGHTDEIDGIAFSPCGKYALSGSKDSTVRLWKLVETEDLSNLHRLSLFSPDVEGRKVSVNGVVIAPVKQIRWEWGDGTIDQHHFFPNEHIYRQLGVYILVVTTIDEQGRTTVAKLPIYCGENVIAVDSENLSNLHRLSLFSPDVEGRKVFVNGVVIAPIEQIRWDWGDGTIDQHHFFPNEHIYGQSGFYVLVVTTIDKKGRTTVEKDLIICGENAFVPE